MYHLANGFKTTINKTKDRVYKRKCERNVLSLKDYIHHHTFAVIIGPENDENIFEERNQD
jgi:hypothetical protein